MFKKKPNIKPLAPLRSSDRRKLADQIIADFQLDIPAPPEPSNSEDKVSGSSELSSLRNSLLPDGSLSARFTTTAGPELKTIAGTVYVGAPQGGEQRVLWLKIGERLYPTVYSLWSNPRLVPLLHTHSVVMQKLRSGADFMVPGLTRGPPFPAKAIKGSIVAVANDENPTVPQWVGVCEIDVCDLTAVRGEKGRAVRGVHWEGDELWSWSPGGKGGGSAPADIPGWDIPAAKTIEGAVEDMKLSSEEDESPDGGVELGIDPEMDRSAGHSNEITADDNPSPDAVHSNEIEIYTKDIDEAFRRAFLFGLHKHRLSNPEASNHGLVFPLSSSFVISDLVLPLLPIFTPAEAAAFQIKKTSWKNARKFIKFLDKELLVKAKSQSGGEVSIWDVDWDDRRIKEFVPYDLPKKGHGHAGKASGAGAEAAKGEQLEILKLFKPKQSLFTLFDTVGASTKTFYSGSEIRSVVTKYIESESLVNNSNKRLITINPLLANTVFDPDRSSDDRGLLTRGSVARDALMDRVLAHCSPFWAVASGKESKDDVKPKAGEPPKVTVLLETRVGNKTATRVFGLEVFHVNPQSLADELQKTCASSTSVSQLVGSSPKNPVMEVMIQGPQKDAVIKGLEKRGVKRQWIEVVDKTKKKKK